ncbi:hypothetical protein HBA54_10965 [Pelagibius litoralis]|uniref:Uncharacterized protein n=1 Tax=Pelagibius litoralis TaxID=374515 RepID=A0A967EWZ6_9PROT|nr:hypothetical protein [Pelagibius litoralis]NIA69108.1 hypothetical protein [Pelagibius litoralis]
MTAGACTGPRKPPVSRRGLPRNLVTMLTSGPPGGTDPVLWTLLLSDRPGQSTACLRRPGKNLS